VEEFIKGDIVVIPFPYSDLTNAKRRPALVLAGSSNNDIILCQITSKDTRDSYAIWLTDEDFFHGRLQKKSNIRSNKLFTADEKIILYKIGSLRKEKIDEVISSVINIFKE